MSIVKEMANKKTQAVVGSQPVTAIFVGPREGRACLATLRRAAAPSPGRGCSSTLRSLRASDQQTGEHTFTAPVLPSSGNPARAVTADRYIKKTNTANFCYRKTTSLDSLRQTKSHQQLTQVSAQSSDNESDDSAEMPIRRKSRSTMDLSKAADMGAF